MMGTTFLYTNRNNGTAKPTHSLEIGTPTPNVHGPAFCRQWAATPTNNSVDSARPNMRIRHSRCCDVTSMSDTAIWRLRKFCHKPCPKMFLFDMLYHVCASVVRFRELLNWRCKVQGVNAKTAVIFCDALWSFCLVWQSTTNCLRNHIRAAHTTENKCTQNLQAVFRAHVTSGMPHDDHP